MNPSDWVGLVLLAAVVGGTVYFVARPSAPPVVVHQAAPAYQPPPPPQPLPQDNTLRDVGTGIAVASQLVGAFTSLADQLGDSLADL